MLQNLDKTALLCYYIQVVNERGNKMTDRPTVAEAAANITNNVIDDIARCVAYHAKGNNLAGATIELYLFRAVAKTAKSAEDKCKDIIKEAYDFPQAGSGKVELDTIAGIKLSATVASRKGGIDTSKLYELIVDAGVDRVAAKQIIAGATKPPSETMTLHTDVK